MARQLTMPIVGINLVVVTNLVAGFVEVFNGRSIKYKIRKGTNTKYAMAGIRDHGK